MKWTQIPLGPLQTNSYIIENNEKECIVIDPGGQGDQLNEWLSAQNLKPIAILLTHAHFDHIGAVDDVREFWKIPVYIHKNEENWLGDSSLNGSIRFGPQVIIKAADEIISNEGQLQISTFEFEIFETPGHSPGSVSFYLKEANVVFSGDALFAGSIGRTDLTGGDYDQLIKSIHEKLLTLPESTIVCPGHGPKTTVQDEMERNPFLNGF